MKIIETKKINSKIQIKNIRELDSEFSLVGCRVAHVGDYDNGFNIDKKVIEDAISTIYNIPIVIEESDIVICGLVPESANPRWIYEDGKEYLVCEVILWTGRYKEKLKSLERLHRFQGVEINVLQKITREDGYQEIEKMEFTAIHI